mmetsp:Transcript_4351/g.5020  ORF Transcript_4351/g.5020 Transcript_4351/m.5020 type:complete len:92 (-) Transcript_4351:195-470(-)|eukprot:CAMPEP_0194134650 /NCGR_PEP_ID=MMETSP0152-20130528/4728_1 /TAXON_ID=1049557 /ORGANISM="Thalassiothrix antarctica, Strain L6-D1" /LENGTH=91 /DNA_ID=CAMNT_0038830485 /DNA_START=51 /DNA_END=326 /DNA_ORIENTATION=-
MTTTKIHVLFFASAREAAGNISSIDIKLQPDKNDTKALRKILADTYPKLAYLVLDEDTMTLALNEEYVPSGEVLPLKDGDTIALIPPISGG